LFAEDNGERDGGKTPDLGTRFLAVIERQCATLCASFGSVSS
jgi:hypothetical protein